ncbi:hypothetical protein NQZ68_001578 [Dissostichus eleginoides]|nr:hypothetical protein NQZ68_001578 [Dissostichus eleginoides]
MHAKRAPYPSGGPAGVYLHLGGYEDRHGGKCYSQRSHLCAVKLRLLEVPEKFSPLLSLPLSPPAKEEDDPWVQEPDQKRLPLSCQGLRLRNQSMEPRTYTWLIDPMAPSIIHQRSSLWRPLWIPKIHIATEPYQVICYRGQLRMNPAPREQCKSMILSSIKSLVRVGVQKPQNL